MKRWLSYRIYGDPSHERWYPKLLRTVVGPFIDQHGSLVDTYFFTAYRTDKENPDSDPGCEPAEEPPLPQVFVRLRLRAEERAFEDLDKGLTTAVDSAASATYLQRSGYNVNADLGTRFATADPEPVVRYLNACSQLMLQWTAEDDILNFEHVASAVHLVANMMEYRLVVGVSVSDRYRAEPTKLP